MELEIGDIIQSDNNKYKVIKLLGSGFYSNVYLVKCKNKLFALKYAEIDDNTENEANNIKKLSNYPNCNKYVSCIYDSFEYEGYIVMVLEYIEGITLEFFIDQNENELNSNVIWDIIKKLINGIHFIHSHHIAHRDIHSGNLMIDNDNNIKYVDFGLACFEKECENSSDYLDETNPPEIFTQEYERNLDFYKAVDMWSLGCMLYILVAGKDKFNYLFRAIHDDFVSGKDIKFNSENKIINKLVVKLLAYDPQDRYTATQALKYVQQNDKYFPQWIFYNFKL